MSNLEKVGDDMGPCMLVSSNVFKQYLQFITCFQIQVVTLPVVFTFNPIFDLRRQRNNATTKTGSLLFLSFGSGEQTAVFHCLVQDRERHTGAC